jgi:serine/threonine protein kinase
VKKIYGGRWCNEGTIGEGGQSHIFRVSDRLGEYSDFLALKRIKNPERRQRFEREVEAVKRLSHENIIKIIDYSAFDQVNDLSEKMFLVMPLAKGGDLSKRVKIYEGSIDSMLKVVMQISSALAYAHDNNVIHRDVKPQNILFTSYEDNHCLLSDFGICLIRGYERITPDDEVVGPWEFMAPESEGGGKLDVTYAADIYSLGKIIYYMISGGIVIPRERIYEKKYSGIFSKGERYGLLKILLSKMICHIDQRLKSMKDVIKELEHIGSWESSARIAPLNAVAKDALNRMKQEQLESQNIKAQNMEARQQEMQSLQDVGQSFIDWLRVELETIRSFSHSEGVLHSEVIDLPADFTNWRTQITPTKWFEKIDGLAITLEKQQETFQKKHALLLMLCRIVEPRITPGGKEPLLPARDVQLVFLPYYCKLEVNKRNASSQWRGYLRRKGNIKKVEGTLVKQSFVSDKHSLTKYFKASEWPSSREEMVQTLNEAMETFITYVSQGADRLDP